MKKTLIVSALALAFAGAAHAESSVTLYGVVDGGVGYSYNRTSFYDGGEANRTSTVGAQSGIMDDNRWGLKGSEDLGNGTSAIFQLEGGFSIASGQSADDGALFGRKAIVGLTSDSWGTFTIGRDYNAGDAFLSSIDPFETDFSTLGAISTFGGVLSDRANAVVKYVSPNMAGFQFGIGYISGTEGIYSETTDDATGTKTKYRNGGVSIGAGYTAGPLYVGLGYDLLYNRDSKTAPNPEDEYDNHQDSSQWTIGATYDFDVVKLHAMYGQQINGSYGGQFNSFGNIYGVDPETGTNVLDEDGLRSQAWMLGISAPVGDSGKVMFSYQGNHRKNDTALDVGYKSQGNIFGIGYTQALSKRTSVYAAAGYGWSVNKIDGEKDSKTQTGLFAIGLNHHF